MDKSFPHSYECDQMDELPGISLLQHYYYPGASTEGGRDGVLVRISPEDGRPWLATFAFGEITPNGASGIFSTPNPRTLCAVARGAGYFVSAAEPRSWESIAVLPIRDVRPVPHNGVIVFANFTHLIAYDQRGVRWRTKRLALDDLKITEVTDMYIKGEFWDIRAGAKGTFLVDLITGASRGGIDGFE